MVRTINIKMLKLKILSAIILSILTTACQNNQVIENALSPAQTSISIPQSIPQYPQGKLINFEVSNHSELIKILWQVNENKEAIKNYYQEKSVRVSAERHQSLLQDQKLSTLILK